jgi:hypothetical protein
MFTFRNYYVLKLLRLETITFSVATLSDINVVLCYVLSQYPICSSVAFVSKLSGCGFLFDFTGGKWGDGTFLLIKANEAMQERVVTNYISYTLCERLVSLET